jgi:hypothetical protein
MRCLAQDLIRVDRSSEYWRMSALRQKRSFQPIKHSRCTGLPTAFLLWDPQTNANLSQRCKRQPIAPTRRGHGIDGYLISRQLAFGAEPPSDLGARWHCSGVRG